MSESVELARSANEASEPLADAPGRAVDPPPARVRKGPHPAAFFLLVLPYGGSFGFVSVALPYIATGRGVPAADIGRVVALAFVPHAWKFLWAPVVDATLSRKRWYLIALALIVLGTFASTAMPITREGLGPLAAVVVASQLGLTLMGMAIEGLMGLGVPEDEKGRAAGWYQAGSFVGLGVGGGAALSLSQRLSQGWAVGAVMSCVMALCALALFMMPEPPGGDAREQRGSLVTHVRTVIVDVWRIATTRRGFLGLAVAISPIGSGAAGNHFAAISRAWSASADTVALVTGALGGLVAAAGAMVGGRLADRMNRLLAYALGGGLTALTGLAMAAAPRTPSAYVAFTLAYAFFNGVTFAVFMAFVLETIGRGAVATKYNVFASLLNFSISYATVFDARSLERYGAGGLLVGDALLTGVGIVVLLALAALLRPRAEAVA